MAAYFVLTQTVTDPERYRKEYIPQVQPFIKKYHAEILVAAGNVEALEGSPQSSMVILKFPDGQSIRDFLADPEYQAVKQIRFESTSHASAVLAPEYNRTSS